MPKRPLLLTAADGRIPVREFDGHAASWLDDGEIRELSKATLANSRGILDKLRWHLRQQEAPEIGPAELRSFFHHIRHGHEEPAGRWGNPKLKAAPKASTSQTYFIALETFFS